MDVASGGTVLGLPRFFVTGAISGITSESAAVSSKVLGGAVLGLPRFFVTGGVSGVTSGSAAVSSKVLLSGGCDIDRVGVTPFCTRDGEDTGPRDLLGEDPIFVLIGDRERGGKRFLPLRARLITSVGSGMVPNRKEIISHGFSKR